MAPTPRTARALQSLHTTTRGPAQGGGGGGGDDGQMALVREYEARAAAAEKQVRSPPAPHSAPAAFPPPFPPAAPAPASPRSSSDGRRCPPRQVESLSLSGMVQRRELSQTETQLKGARTKYRREYAAEATEMTSAAQRECAARTQEVRRLQASLREQQAEQRRRNDSGVPAGPKPALPELDLSGTYSHFGVQRTDLAKAQGEAKAPPPPASKLKGVMMAMRWGSTAKKKAEAADAAPEAADSGGGDGDATDTGHMTDLYFGDSDDTADSDEDKPSVLSQMLQEADPKACRRMVEAYAEEMAECKHQEEVMAYQLVKVACRRCVGWVRGARGGDGRVGGVDATPSDQRARSPVTALVAPRSRLTVCVACVCGSWARSVGRAAPHAARLAPGPTGTHWCCGRRAVCPRRRRSSRGTSTGCTAT